MPLESCMSFRECKQITKEGKEKVKAEIKYYNKPYEIDIDPAQTESKRNILDIPFEIN